MRGPVTAPTLNFIVYYRRHNFKTNYNLLGKHSSRLSPNQENCHDAHCGQMFRYFLRFLFAPAAETA